MVSAKSNKAPANSKVQGFIGFLGLIGFLFPNISKGSDKIIPVITAIMVRLLLIVSLRSDVSLDAGVGQ